MPGLVHQGGFFESRWSIDAQASMNRDQICVHALQGWLVHQEHAGPFPRGAALAASNAHWCTRVETSGRGGVCQTAGSMERSRPRAYICTALPVFPARTVPSGDALRVKHGQSVGLG